MYYTDLNMAPQLGLAASFARVAIGGIAVKFSPVAFKVLLVPTLINEMANNVNYDYFYPFLSVQVEWSFFFLFYIKLSSSNGSNAAFQWKSSKI